MSRRDIIIIAVLINAGLLVVIFTSALKSDNNDHILAAQTENVVTLKTQNPVIPSSPMRGDEVDQVLSQFAAVPQSQETAALATPIVQPVTVAPTAQANEAATPSSSFLEEAQGFNTAPSIVPATPKFPLPEETSTPTYTEVKVKKGDALEKIARMHHTTVQEIMRSNKLSSTQLKIGQVLKIPSRGNKQHSGNKKGLGEAHFYVVKTGDNPWTIAIKNQMKVEELLELNGLNEERARKLKPGDQLRIR